MHGSFGLIEGAHTARTVNTMTLTSTPSQGERRFSAVPLAV